MSVHPDDETSPLFWACGCDGWFVQENSVTRCHRCGEWQANSRNAYCLEVFECSRTFTEKRRTSSLALASFCNSTNSEKGMTQIGTVQVSSMEWVRCDDNCWHLVQPTGISYVPHTDGDFVGVATCFGEKQALLEERYMPILAVILHGRFHYIGGEEEATQRFEETKEMMLQTDDQRELVLWHSKLGVIDQKL